jgi:hypothetical protein
MAYCVEFNFKFEDAKKHRKVGEIVNALSTNENCDPQWFLNELKSHGSKRKVQTADMPIEETFRMLCEGLKNVNVNARKITLATTMSESIEQYMYFFLEFIVRIGGKPLPSTATGKETIVTFKNTKSGLKCSIKDRWLKVTGDVDPDGKPKDKVFDLDNPDDIDLDTLVGTWIVTSYNDYTEDFNDIAKLSYIAIPERIIIGKLEGNAVIKYIDDSGHEHSADGDFIIENKVMRLITHGLTDIGTKLKTIESEIQLFGNYLRAKYTVSNDTYTIWIAERLRKIPNT